MAKDSLHAGTTEEISFPQVVNFPILTIKDIAIFAVKFTNFSKPVAHKKLAQISEIGTGKISTQTWKTQGI